MQKMYSRIISIMILSSLGLNAIALAPTVILSSPVDAATGVARDQKIKVTFSKAINPEKINGKSFYVTETGSTVHIEGKKSYSKKNRIATFKPSQLFAANTNYSATVTTKVKDRAGNPLANNFVWTFSTGQTQYQTVDLGAAAAFAILAGSTVTNTGASIVHGDIGLSPGSEVGGFPPGTLDGTQHVNDTSSAQAQLDLTTAYNDAAGRTLASISVSGNIGGQTLAPGLYKATSDLEISSGDLTLDAQGDANAVFIFQITSGFVVTSGRQVILSGGAQAANIFWQVGSSATFGTSSVFKGTIMADQSISFDTGATLDGRALARIGAVTLEGNTITRP
jgi:hypothetical protein